MNLMTGVESSELFGGDVPESIRHLIDSVRGAARDEIGAALWAAVLCAPRSLPAYYLLYKFHAAAGELAQAHQVATKALAVAAEQASLASDWRMVHADAADFSMPGPARFWLFTLKALAFINVRLGERDVARALVGKLRALDPADRLGFGVIEAMLAQIGPQH
ncbi:hypothetical protein WKR88_08185 [Trinickia caryophylli]|uniref:Tetratricopeptide repeat-containing protein n=1 Tax=Trinickia caryophylli TaxID=28094 RepID=A0A1X7EFK7_TRICW|nr:hypothetical protein [Trinickia caryophylli]PMS11096.1 hypothetical protein C0Z17_16545 [Trinickia caryophylli]TRX14551.1 hypothetical protein FNF07_25170 [Trinickia caryophylli]WQE14390.1 hypothetical protein U0034_27360 [Trinickia caryophylli]SMF33145.1 hypothetical protein SAMN06295900_105328 [Trinickia caryophylli]GLU32212.1 hypothetical protein Busp01_20540 [Trinickia caryophylli]